MTVGREATLTEKLVKIDESRDIYAQEVSPGLFSGIRYGPHSLRIESPVPIEEIARILTRFEASISQFKGLYPEQVGTEFRTVDGLLFDYRDPVTSRQLACTSFGVFEETENSTIHVESLLLSEVRGRGQGVLDDTYARTRPEWRNSFSAEIATARHQSIVALIEEYFREQLADFQKLPYQRGVTHAAQESYNKKLKLPQLTRTAEIEKVAQGLGIGDEKILLRAFPKYFEICKRYLEQKPFNQSDADRVITDLKVLVDGRTTRTVRTFRGISGELAPESLIYSTTSGDVRESVFDYLQKGRKIYQQWKGARLAMEQSPLENGSNEARLYNTSNGALQKSAQWIVEGERSVCAAFTLNDAEGRPVRTESYEGKCVHFYDEGGARVASISYGDDARDLSHRWVFTGDDRYVSTYNVEKLRSPGLTVEQYLDRLAQELHTPQLIAWYLRVCMEYRPDGPEDWQSASRTVQRIEKGVSLGDCEDYAFLAREILRRQGYNAHVILVPNHAECVWLTRDSAGRYFGWSLGTFGLDCNGERYQSTREFTHGGFSSAREALQSLMTKYREGGEGMPVGTDVQINPDSIALGDLGFGTAGTEHRVSLSYLMPSAKK